jgi:hypothetical protein
MMSTTQLSKKHLNLLHMPIGEHKNIIWQKPNGDLDFVSKYISVNQLSIRGVYGLFLERIYQKMYIAKFTHTSFGEPNLEQMSRSFLRKVFLREFRDGFMKYCNLVGSFLHLTCRIAYC